MCRRFVDRFSRKRPLRGTIVFQGRYEQRERLTRPAVWASLVLVGTSFLSSACGVRAGRATLDSGVTVSNDSSRKPAPGEHAMSDSNRGKPRSDDAALEALFPNLDSTQRARAIERQRRQDQRAREEASRERERAVKEPLQFGIIDGPLPENAIGYILRDPSAATKRLIVFSTLNLSDAAIQIARNALFEDQYELPLVTERRVLLVWADQRVRVGNAWRQMHYWGMETAGKGDAAGFLAAPRGEKILIPEVGAVQIVEVEK
jgi:hypothetical protein